MKFSRILSFLLALLTCFSLAACTKKGADVADKNDRDKTAASEQNKEDENQEGGEGDGKEDAETPEPEKLTHDMVVFADEVRYCYSDGGAYTSFLFKKYDLYGAMKEDGDLLLDANYSEVSYQPSEALDGHFLPFFSKAEDGGDGLLLLPDGDTNAGLMAGFGFVERAEVYWNVNTNSPVLFLMNPEEQRKVAYSAEDYLSYSSGYYGSECYTTFLTHNVIPVRAVTSADVFGEEYKEIKVTYAHNNYALFDVKSGKLVSEFVYTDFGCTGDVLGVLPMKKASGWGFCNAKGEEITEFIYESHGENEWDGSPKFLPAANGYIALKKDGLWGFCDANGNVVVSPQFEETSLVNANGFFFAKVEDNTWGRFTVK